MTFNSPSAIKRRRALSQQHAQSTPDPTPSSPALEQDAFERESLGELRDRVRAWSELPESFYTPDRVRAISTDTWEVRIDARVKETVRAEVVKDESFSYQVYVVARDVDPQANP